MIAITKRANKTKSPRRHARDLIQYLTKEDREGGYTCVGASPTFLDLSNRQGFAYFEALAAAATTARGSTVHHVVLTWNDGDTVTREQQNICIVRILKALDALDLDFIAIEHHDTQHKQIHLVINRVDPRTFKIRQLGGRWPIRETVKEVARINKDFGWDSPDRPEICNAKWKASEDGQVVRNERDDLDLSQGARDGEWAARRAGAKETTADRVFAFRQAWREQEPRNWQEFHELADEYGLAYVRKGKGAVWQPSAAWEDMQTIKASSAMELSYRKLAARYGEYKKPDVHVIMTKARERREKEREQQRQAEEFREWCDSVWRSMAEAGMTPSDEEVEMIRAGQIPPRFSECVSDELRTL